MADKAVTDVIINYQSVGLDKVGSEIKQTSAALDGLVVASLDAEKATASLENRFKGLERGFGTAEGNASKYAKVQDSVNKAVAQNPALQERGNELLAKAAEKYGIATRATDAHANSSKLARYELINLSRQIQDVGVSLFSGQSPLTVAVQQGSQTMDVFTSSGVKFSDALKQLGGIASSVLTPVNLIAAGVVAVGAAAAVTANQLDKVQVSSQRALIGAGARTGTSVGDLNSFVGQNSGFAGTGLSSKEARELAESFTATGDIVVSRLHGMSDAVVGFANQTGKSVSEASKDMVAFAADPMKALDDLGKVFGTFDEATRKSVEALVLAGDKTGAFQVEIDAIAAKSKKAAENMGFFERAARAVVNVLATETVKPSGLEDQLAAVERKIAEQGNGAARSRGSQDALNTQRGDLLNQISAASIQAITEETAKLNTEQGRSQQQVAAIAKSWGDVGTETALALNTLQQQVEISGAVTGEQQQAAQYAADFANAALAGKTALEGEAIASAKLRVSQAAATSAVEKQVDALKDQAAMIKAHQKGTEATTAAAIAYKNAIESGADEASAAALQSQMMSNYMLQAVGATAQWRAELLGVGTELTVIGANYSSILQKQQQIDQATAAYNQQLMQAAQSGKSGFATDGTHDVNHGTRYTSEGGNPGTNAILRMMAADQSSGVQGGTNAVYSSSGIQAALAYAKNYSNTSGVDPAIASIASKSGYNLNALFGSPTPTIGDKISVVDELTGLLNAQTTDKGAQIGNLQSEMDWLQTLPTSIERDQKIVSLQQSIDQLKESTDGLNATNSELLSPYYTQDPRTSHIGFRSQGMASGGWVDVPGAPSANDNMTAIIPVAGGERIFVDPNRSVRGGGGAQRSISVVNHITIAGNASKDEVGRTMFQTGQTMARQLRAVSQ